ncbi:COG4223 family protein [Paracoccus ravus]|uniref:COG4223 family protein n=1 Tax=Paracoccus ravus TaxID=2447760 RepID=UPI001FD712DF|nr:hypothetical protein [Paracoccus ravus]
MIESSLVGAGSETQAAVKRGAAEAPAATAAPVGPAAAVGRPDPAPAETRPVVTRKVGFFPTFLGGVVAAGLGAAATYWAIPHLPEAWRPGTAVAVSPEAQLDAARQVATETVRAELATQAEVMTTRAAQAGADAARQSLADSAAAQPAPATLAELPPEISDRMAALEASVADLGARPAPAAAPADSTVTNAPPPPPPGVSPEELAALAARVDAQQAQLEELAARPAVDPSTAEQVQTLVKQAEDLQKTTQEANRRAQGATAAASLKAAIESGAPRDEALAALSGAGVSVPAVLTGDVPRLDQLRADFAPAAREGLRASLDAVAADEGAMGMIGNFLRVQTGARSVEPREGNDPDAVLSRANAAVEAGDISGALEQISALPEPGQQAMSGWTARAQTWIEANAALAELAASGK